MKKLVLLCMAMLLLLPLAACRDLTELQRPFDVQHFLPDDAQILNQNDGMLLFDIQTHEPQATFDALLDDFEETLYFLQNWQEISREDEDGLFVIEGIYGENKNRLTISVRQGDYIVRVLLGFMDEMR